MTPQEPSTSASSSPATAMSSSASRPRLVVRLDDPLVAAHHRNERWLLRRDQRHVAAGAVGHAAVNLLASEPPCARNLAFENPAERLRIDRAGEPERRRAPALPGARLTVRVVVPGSAVLLDIVHALRRRSDLAVARYPRGSLPPEAERRTRSQSIPARYAPSMHETGTEQTGSSSRRRMTSNDRVFR